MVVRKLSEAFRNDFTIEEACSYAEISKDTYYRWCKENGDFSDEMERVKNFVITEAKKVVKRAIMKGDIRTSQWLLERKQKELYGKEAISLKYERPPEQLSKEEEAEIEAILKANNLA